jgi:hypothetical protein
MDKKRGRPRMDPTDKLQTRLISLIPEAARAFDILKAEQGPRTGPRLAAEAIDLLLILYGKQPIEEEHTGWIATRKKEPAAAHEEAKPTALTSAGSMRSGFVSTPVLKPAKKKQG